MDIIYKEISWIKYKFLSDRSGYYKVIGNGEYYTFEKDSSWHNEKGPAVYYSNKDYSYYLNGEYYGSSQDYTNEQWIRFCKLKAFQ